MRAIAEESYKGRKAQVEMVVEMAAVENRHLTAALFDAGILADIGDMAEAKRLITEASRHHSELGRLLEQAGQFLD